MTPAEHLPSDSILHHWLAAYSLAETPTSYTMLTGLSALGACLKRNIWFNQGAWRVYPNISILLVGPTGVGKDTAIDRAEELIKELEIVPTIGGKTIEAICEALINLPTAVGQPKAAAIFAQEISSFIGSADYQKSMMTDLTDLLSTKSAKNISLKSAPDRIIFQPTITMQAGSTKEWLKTMLPKGSLEGGFLPRFIIAVEDYPKHHVPLPYYHQPKSVTLAAAAARSNFADGIREICKRFANPTSITPLTEADHLYTNWYCRRFQLFSPMVIGYANRARDQVLRLAMLCAVSRMKSYIDAADINFGIEVITSIGQRIEEAVIPQTPESKCAEDILRFFDTGPKSKTDLTRKFKNIDRRVREAALTDLLEAQRLKYTGKHYERLDG